MPIDQHYLDTVLNLEEGVRKIGQTLREVHGKSDYAEKHDGLDLVTAYDTKTEEELKALIRAVDPGTPFVGEESGGDTTVKKYWLVDPIDGTIHFVRGFPLCSIMLALIENDRPVASIIYNFSTDEFFYAARGCGAFMNGEPIKVSTRGERETVLLGEFGLKRPDVFTAYGALVQKYRKIMNTICAGTEFAAVAQGRVEGRVILNPYGKSYDFAPGVLLIQEAGGVAKNLKGEDYTTADADFIVAATEELYESLLDTIMQSGYQE